MINDDTQLKKLKLIMDVTGCNRLVAIELWAKLYEGFIEGEYQDAYEKGYDSATYDLEEDCH